MSDFFKFMRGLWYGALIGGVAALLFAPKRGEELRQDIRQQVKSFEEEARSKATTKMKQASEQLSQQADTLERKAGELEASGANYS
ncbi:MAG TPA: YtxH domain-containing protein [Aggregatilineales bacterium]|nr:YtxH domain-containing protein [Aggregatilineales bacterium]